jgi:hypothetical protein
MKGKKYTFKILATDFNPCTSVACAIDPSVTMYSTDFSFQNLVILNLFEFFSVAEITLKSISPTF